PALADANDVLAGIERVPGVIYVALVPNLRGVHNATAAPRRPDEVNGVVSASETHNRANINRTHEQSLADTTGMANPRQVRELTRKVLERFPPPHETYYTLHFHNTRGMGLANVVAGIEAGVRSFDGSVSGLGVCSNDPGATENICTEDMVNMLEDMGYDTRVDLAKLLAVARRIPSIVGHDVPGQV